MSVPTAKASSEPSTMPKLSWPWKVAMGAGLTFVLALGFLGYFMPGVRLNWETIAAMCGF